MENTVDYRGDIIVHGVLYVKDMANDQLVERAHPANKLSLKALYDDGLYLNGWMNPFGGIGSLQLPFSLDERVVLPRLSLSKELLYTPNLTDERIRAINLESIAQQRGFQGIDAVLCSRLNGNLPRIEFLGASYEINLVEDYLQELGEPRRLLHFTGFNPQGLKGGYRFLHVPGSDQFIAVNARLLAIPEGAIMVEMDNMVRIDPVGAALKFGFPATALLSRFMMPDKTGLRVLQLSDTDILEVVRRNWLSAEASGQSPGMVSSRGGRINKSSQNGIRS